MEAYVKCSVDHFSVDEAQPLPPAIPFRLVVRSVGSTAQQSTCLKIYSALLSSPGSGVAAAIPLFPLPPPVPHGRHAQRRRRRRLLGRPRMACGGRTADGPADAIHRFYLRHPSAAIAMAVLEISPEFERGSFTPRIPERIADAGSGKCNARNLQF